MKIEKLIQMPKDLLSEGNTHDHWTKLRKRNQSKAMWLKTVSWDEITDIKLPCLILPCLITLTRIAPRELDYDNWVTSAKHFRDVMADLLIPGRAKGQADSNKQLYWAYNQEKGKPKQYALKITIEDMGESRFRNLCKNKNEMAEILEKLLVTKDYIEPHPMDTKFTSVRFSRYEQLSDDVSEETLKKWNEQLKELCDYKTTSP